MGLTINVYVRYILKLHNYILNTGGLSIIIDCNLETAYDVYVGIYWWVLVGRTVLLRSHKRNVTRALWTVKVWVFSRVEIFIVAWTHSECYLYNFSWLLWCKMQFLNLFLQHQSCYCNLLYRVHKALILAFTFTLRLRPNTKTHHYLYRHFTSLRLGGPDDISCLRKPDEPPKKAPNLKFLIKTSNYLAKFCHQQIKNRVVFTRTAISIHKKHVCCNSFDIEMLIIC